MDNVNQEFHERLLQIFQEEAQEHLRHLSEGLISLEKEQLPELKSETLETIFRAAHSLKSAARAVDLIEIESLCHSAENAFSALKRDQLTISSTLLDILHEIVDTVTQLLSAKEKDVKEQWDVSALIKKLEDELKKSTRHVDTDAIANPIESTQKKPQPASPHSPRQHKPILANTVRVSKTKLDALLLQAEELLSIKLATAQRTMDIRDTVKALTEFKKGQAKVKPIRKSLLQAFEQSKTNNYSRLTEQQSIKLIELLSSETEFVQLFDNLLGKLLKSAEQDERLLNIKVGGLLEDMKKAMMQPISTTLLLFPKLVRDISREQGKCVDLIIHGADTEIDRRILEEMYDPLIHIVRNCIDHGIEKPNEREQLKKPSQGTITMTIKEQEGGHIEILVSDDGAGIDFHKISEKARKLGLIDPNIDESDKQAILPLIFQSGVSTNSIVTDLSGRGLGLAIVWEKTEKLGGLVTVETHLGKGTTFRIVLPLTLATFRGVYVQVNTHQFLLPTAQIVQCLRVHRDAIKSVENLNTIVWQGETIAFVSLAEVLQLPIPTENQNLGEYQFALLLGSAGKKIAFGVDEIHSEEDVLVKNLNKQLARVRNIAGVTLRSNGKVVPILNVADLLRSAMKLSPASKSYAPVLPGLLEKKSILVVEDSITSRTLLKNILETASYQVSTAVDGMDAFTQLKTEVFDLVLSDVDMPKMNGFELTKKIRSDHDHDQLPVVLVTALGSDEDRERGIKAGANAYIVKSNFDQSNLLEIVRRLI